MRNVKKSTLENGLRLILVSNPSSLASTVLVLVEAGSEYEPREINGISHFLEHMCFKGTDKRPRAGMIDQELDALGSEYSAFTSHEYTGYWAKAENHKLKDILELISDIYLHPIFNKDEIEKEKGVVIEEMNLYEDTPAMDVQDLFLTVLYGDQPAGRPVLGRKEFIQTISRAQLTRYREKHYIAPATVVVVAGNFNQTSMAQEVKRIFGKLPRLPKEDKLPTLERQEAPQLLLKSKETNQSHFVLGFRTVSAVDKRRYVSQVMANLLGGGMSSRLWAKVREELGAAYYVRAASEFFRDRGYLEISAGVDHAKIETVIKAVLAELKRLCSENVPLKEMQKVKDNLIGRLIMGLETSDELASFYGGQEILARSFIGTAKLIDEIKAVTSEDIRGFAQEFFINSGLNLAIIGPYKDGEPFRKILTL